MNENPYAPPRADVQLRIDESGAPKSALKNIRKAFIAGCIGCSHTLVYSVEVSGPNIIGYTPWRFIDAAVVAALTFGIYKKSRTCAVIMFLYFIGSNIFSPKAVTNGGLIIGAIFLYYYAKGIYGTFQYQSWRKAQGAVW